MRASISRVSHSCCRKSFDAGEGLGTVGRSRWPLWILQRDKSLVRYAHVGLYLIEFRNHRVVSQRFATP